jgi:hypothetical protein
MGKESWGDLLSLWDRKKSTSCLCHTRDSIPDFWWRFDLFDSNLKLYNPKFALLFLSFLKTKHGFSQKGFCCTWRRDCFGRKRRAFDAYNNTANKKFRQKYVDKKQGGYLMLLNRDFAVRRRRERQGGNCCMAFVLISGQTRTLWWWA